MPRPKLHTSGEVFIAIQAFMCRHGIPPTCEELRQILGVRSTRTILRYLRTCEADGMIRRWPGARGLALKPESKGGEENDLTYEEILTEKIKEARADAMATFSEDPEAGAVSFFRAAILQEALDLYVNGAERVRRVLLDAIDEHEMKQDELQS